VIAQTLIITNTGVRMWPTEGSRPVYLSYHWIQPATRRVLILDGVRTRLPRAIAPGESAIVTANVEVPNLLGTLTLQWDLVQENVTWFGTRGSPVAEVKVNVTSEQPALETVPLPILPQLGSTSSPPRSELWRAGVKMWLAYPLLGVGPDNFRHVYGTYLGQMEFNDRITANSWYVEVLATAGVIGMITGMLVVAAGVMLMRQYWRTLATRSTRVLAVGLSVALLSFFIHGLVDYFMEFTPTYSLFWLTAGLLIGLLTGTTDDEVARPTDRV
jgi:O-Antigen ligase